MKRMLFILAVVISCVGINNVSASEVYYSNSNGILLTKKEYDFISEILWDGYQENMTMDEYNIILSNGVSKDIQKEEYIPMTPFATTHTTNAKSLSITKASFSNYTLISVTTKWLGSPVVRSYDLIGAYLDRVSLMGSVATRLSSTSGAYSSSYIKSDSNGFGVSIKLPDTGTDIIVSQTFKVTGSGNVYASYQHATSNIILANSQNYTISRLGSGGVFLFDNSIYNIYDRMGGVNISI